MNGGNDYEYFQPIRPGDAITTRSKIVDISEREGRAGKLIIVLTERTLTNQKGEVVGIAPGILEPTALRSEEYERALAYTRGITVEELRKGYKRLSIPLGRVGRLKEVADTVCFLASPRAGYIHGTTVNVSGGKSRA